MQTTTKFYLTGMDTAKKLGKTNLIGKSVGSYIYNPDYRESSIDLALKADERREKELKLLEKQLNEPVGNRNQALFEKYKMSQSGLGKIDGYEEPNETREQRIISKVKYKYKCYFPTNDKISMESRPTKFYVTLDVVSDDLPHDEFAFYFPVSRDPTTAFQFKIDFMDCYINDAGEPVTNGNSIYEQIYRGEIRDYYITGHNIAVQKTRIKNETTNKEEDKKVIDDTEYLVKKASEIKDDDYQALFRTGVDFTGYVVNKVGEVEHSRAPSIKIGLIAKKIDEKLDYILISKTKTGYPLRTLEKDVKEYNEAMLTDQRAVMSKQLADLVKYPLKVLNEKGSK